MIVSPPHPLAAVNDCLFGHEKDLVPLLVAIQNRGAQTDRGPNRVGQMFIQREANQNKDKAGKAADIKQGREGKGAERT